MQQVVSKKPAVPSVSVTAPSSNEFDRGVKSRASERYPVPNKKRAPEIDVDKENCKPVAAAGKKPAQQKQV